MLIESPLYKYESTQLILRRGEDMSLENRVKFLEEEVATLKKQILLHEGYITSLKEANFILLQQMEEQINAVITTFEIASQKKTC